MTPAQRAAALYDEMSAAPLILDVDFDVWIKSRMAAAILATQNAAAERMRKRCAAVAEGAGGPDGHALAREIRALPLTE